MIDEFLFVIISRHEKSAIYPYETSQPENYWIFIGSESTRGVVSRPARISPWRDNFSELINIQFIIVLSQFDNNALDGV